MDNIQTIMIAIIIGSMAIVGMFTFYSTTVQKYGITVSEDIQPLYIKAVTVAGNDTSSSSIIMDGMGTNISDAILNRTTKESDAVSNVIANTKNAFTFLFNIVPLTYGLIDATVPILGIPRWVVTSIIVILIVIFLIAAIKIFFKVSS